MDELDVLDAFTDEALRAVRGTYDAVISLRALRTDEQALLQRELQLLLELMIARAERTRPQQPDCSMVIGDSEILRIPLDIWARIITELPKKRPMVTY